ENSELSFETGDLKRHIRQESQSDIHRLLKKYRLAYTVNIFFLLVFSACVFLRPDNPEFIVSVALIILYYVITGVYLTTKLFQFRLPDLNQDTHRAISETLSLAKSINRVMGRLLVIFLPVAFLGGLLAGWTYKGASFAELWAKPWLLPIFGGLTLGVGVFSYYYGKRLANPTCQKLIVSLEDSLKALED
ncbi:MAG: hypothetical protein AAFU64_07285, partial [Bacteroidota bacterium]